jgi:Tfp pilus assembly protein PilV
MSARMQLSGESGFTVVEAIVGIVMLSIGLVGLAKASALGFSQVTRARQDMQYAADLQQVMDSLQSRGYGLVTSGSVTLRGRAVSWTVTSPSATSQLVTVVAQRWGYQNMTGSVQDTLLLYLANRVLPS